MVRLLMATERRYNAKETSKGKEMELKCAAESLNGYERALEGDGEALKVDGDDMY